ncbi:hypothetical protein ACUMKS_003304 [Proteus mirabilis]|uniref:hypothetical protein n=3 Tax=Proteus mirabilis TaxID=584 RepID=UPI0018C53A14|nr:hypothetical protein [Proteus mirabilis]EKU2371072.1 hypothetical protein [Proteus mirabilis]EKU7867702.1 hypothetical protein [Proteus mirabilis]EKU7918793.1 hypothetical protein [Proteus mirabilis]EKU7920152.1 hypothetical protein [Proteus mirabilis]EKU8689168.1 hypothetical protein [Proteus mirabilis]
MPKEINELQFSLHYASETDSEMNISTILTANIHTIDGDTQQLTQLICTTSSEGKKQYRIGLQKISDAGDPLLVAIESYWRKNTQESCVYLLEKAKQFIQGHLQQTNTWISMYGLVIVSNASLEELLPEGLLKALKVSIPA